MAGLLIETVAPGSPAERAGLQPGQRLLTIDGQPLRDLIDYAYLAFDDEAELTVIDAAGTQRTVQFGAGAGRTAGTGLCPAANKALRQQLRLLLRPSTAQGIAPSAVCQGRGLPALLPARHLRHPDQPEKNRTAPDYCPAPVAALHLGACHRAAVA